jgi:hypothetical protein
MQWNNCLIKIPFIDMSAKKWIFLFFFLVGLIIIGCNTFRSGKNSILLADDFRFLPRGPLGSELGAETEYHFLHQARPRGNWSISTFRYNLSASWSVRETGGKRFLYQDGVNPDDHWHPMIIAGSLFWTDYRLNTKFSPDTLPGRVGIVFRYRHDRSYYFFGLENDSAKLIMVDQGIAFRKPYEKILAGAKFAYGPDDLIEVNINVLGSDIRVSIDGGPAFQVTDTVFKEGKIGFLADVPASFYAIQVSTTRAGFNDFTSREKRNREISDSLMTENPKPAVYKKISTEGFGVGRNLRFGDLDGDRETDVLVGQVIHHGPKDANSELSCLTAITLDGKILWKIGSPDGWKTHLTNDVAFQIHDINQDGKNEVIYCMNQQLIIAEGRNGRTIKKIPTPLVPEGKPPSRHNIFKRILGDCIYFADLSGRGYRGDIVLKDRYSYLWTFDRDLNLLWYNECNTGHYPYSYDTDHDGREELIMGYTLFDDDGTAIWSLDTVLNDHADGVAILKYRENDPPIYMCAASDEGMFFTDLSGTILKHHYIGHVQNPAVANFREDLPGLETVSINFWGNQGIIHLYDATGDIYHSFEPNQYGSMCLPVNWTGDSEEFFILNAHVDEGGAYDGFGRKVLAFPDDGHPDMCYAVLDITGDCRDEIVVWDPNEIWVYTQDDNPQPGTLYKPLRNPLYNYSNYQATVSLQEWE